MRRIASSLIIVSLLLSFFVFAIAVQPARAQTETIYINPDGSISSPVPANITTSDNVTYNFMDNNYLPIVVQRSNITIDGAGYALGVNQPGYGISWNNVNNVTLKNVNIGFEFGVSVANSSQNKIIGNSITQSRIGVVLTSSFDDSIAANNILAWTCIYLNSSSDVNVNANNITGENPSSGGVSGIFLQNSAGVNINANNITATIFQPLGYLDGYGVYLNSSSNNSVTANNITTNGGLQSYFRGVYLMSSSNNSMTANSIRAFNSASWGIYLGLSLDNKIAANSIGTSSYGVYLDSSSSNTVSGNNIMNNTYGIYLWGSSSNSISENDMANGFSGCDLFSSSNNNVVFGNNITNNGKNGVYLFSSSNYNVISGNSITNNSYGVGTEWSSNYNIVSENNIIKNYFGITLYSSSNIVYHNNFINNTQQASSGFLANVWDDGYPSGGNYWSNYTGFDQFHGKSQNIPGSDGIGDTPYTIDANNADHYPLMRPFKTFNAGTWNNVTYSVDIVSNSTLGNFSFNSTARTLSFSVTGVNGTMGFCRVTIPKGLMWTSTDAEWMVTVNGTLIGDRFITNDTSNTYIYFAYHHSTQSIQIQSTGAVPEFQPFMLMPLLMIITLFGAMILQRKRKSGKESIVRPNSPVI